MLESLLHLRSAAKTGIDKAGKRVKVVEYEDACAALYIRGVCLVRFFQLFLEEIVQSQAQGEKKEWDKVFEDRLEEFEDNNRRVYISTIATRRENYNKSKK